MNRNVDIASLPLCGKLIAATYRRAFRARVSLKSLEPSRPIVSVSNSLLKSLIIYSLNLGSLAKESQKISLPCCFESVGPTINSLRHKSAKHADTRVSTMCVTSAVRARTLYIAANHKCIDYSDGRTRLQSCARKNP